MKKMELLEGIGEMDEAWIAEAARPVKRIGMKRHLLRVAAATAAVLAISVIIPNLNAEAADAMQRLPVVGSYFKAVTFRQYSYYDAKHVANVEQPVIENADEAVNKDIDQAVTRAIDDFKQAAAGDGYAGMNVDYEVVSETEQYYCLRLAFEETAADGYEYSSYYVLDRKSGQQVDLMTFLDTDDKVQAANEAIVRQMKDEMAADDSRSYFVDDADDLEGNFTTVTKETQFYVKDARTIVVCFAEGEVAPYYMGECRFEISLEDVGKGH